MPVKPISWIQSAAEILNFERNEGYLPGSILNVVLFETAGTLRTDIRNKFTGAIGLLQFMPKTLKALGYTSEQAGAMTVREQLEKLCKPYLAQYKGRILKSADWLDTYLAVFYPVAIGKPDTFVIGPPGTKVYQQNKVLDFDKDGDIEKGDIRKKFAEIVTAIRNKTGLPKFDFAKGAALSVGLVALFAIGLIFLANKG